MRPVVVTVGPLAAAAANNIAQSQAIGAAGPITLNGSLVVNGVAILDKPRRVAITSAGNDVGILFTIVGTNWSGNPVTETFLGGNASAVSSALDYATVTSIRSSGATAAAITVGTTAVAASPWVRLSEYSTPQTALQTDVIGTVNYTIQSTLDDPNDPSNPVPPGSVVWVNTSDTAGVNATGNIQSNFVAAPRWVRVLLNSGSGMVTLTVYQLGSVTGLGG